MAKKIKIFIDPGHGGSDPGAVANGLREKDLTLAIAKALKKYLEQFEGIDVRLSREDDRFLSLAERTRLANEWGADIFISIHINAGGGTGFETFVFTNASSKSVAYQNVIHEEIMKVMGVTDRGKKRANFAVLRTSRMPAILTENLFIDRASDAAKLKDPTFISYVAKGHGEGIVKVFGLKRKSGAASKPTASKPVVKPTPNKTTTSQPKQSKSGDQVVRAIQAFVNNYGFGIAVDGIAGPQTMRALIRVLQTELNKQFGRGLVIDGIFGSRTRAALINLRAGASGNLTRVLQALLHIKGFNPGPFDGVFGDMTTAAVRSFQRARRLSVDGIAGPQTWGALLG
ncbi:N-acetylmuramoyl-L-alanine amidase [Halalkalibacterium halodurans]|uniref:N-acetylmuramoyl-L-alanine amidase n=1 Tax=Halalkalibacterium halodurans TaxID=86665 RepID=UPI002E1E03F9|nr:N-acetylmuramoyl-L-alanine amidase [Halalkalibacterium halodurans]MED4080091.1 N-acetylmuramoyl-L-alanine amidase [Halalkalibacterium halodurans]MED4084944.1 N-acetylmuramoyl-L-alanine amidase [Halalkalibacterium halodurans]MED4104911.1 N-acetylmuramoyl-L-alanine amidase [Halalkalibacterium halodurans]MED4110428.1 N-acetylmuramoyl-L-alanine amidase [Halalkalibacterium halodurans]MED4123038.1 N-acetylmuramoyl-L-alanine amidase [Halalkalibacterium halodurans]